MWYVAYILTSFLCLFQLEYVHRKPYTDIHSRKDIIQSWQDLSGSHFRRFWKKKEILGKKLQMMNGIGKQKTIMIKFMAQLFIEMHSSLK